MASAIGSALSCFRCAYRYPQDLGRYGCPNCLGDGLDGEPLTTRELLMCMADGGEGAEFLVESWPKARKVHTCEECGRLVQPGERYARHFGVQEGEPFHGLMCSHCAVLRDWLSANCGAYLFGCIVEDILEHARDYARLDLYRLAVLAQHDWRTPRRGRAVPVPKQPAPLTLKGHA